MGDQKIERVVLITFFFNFKYFVTIAFLLTLRGGWSKTSF